MGTYTSDTIVSVQPFTQQPEGEDVIIGRSEAGVFLAVPPEAVELLENLAQGKSIGEVSSLYQQKYGEIPDLDDFLVLMESKGFVKSFDAQSTRASSATATRPIRYHFTNVSYSVAQRFFSGPAMAGYFVLIAFAVLATIRHPALMTGPQDLYFPDHRTLCLTILTAATYLSIFLHELAHLMAARAAGVDSRMGISHRLWYMVAETDLTNLWAVPKRRRYMPLLAGTILDAVLSALIVVALYLHVRGWLALSVIEIRVLRAMIFTNLMRMLWQCFLFIRTDFYYVVSNFFSCRNLMKDTEAFLRNQLARVLSFIRRVDQSDIPASEQRVIRGYALVWLVGRAASFVLLFVVTIPVAVQYTRDVTSVLRTGYSANPANFLDVVLLATYFLVPLGAGVAMWINSLARRERT